MDQQDLSASFSGILRSALDRKRLGHALLFRVIGKTRVAQDEEFIESIKSFLCIERRSSESSCGRCPSCRTLNQLLIGDQKDAAPHPDFLHLKPEKSTGYSVEQIRSMNSFLSLRRNLSPRRLVWIDEAHALASSQGASANALLKTLEEPRPETFFFLTSNRSESILPTIKSRCQSFVFPIRKEAPSTLKTEWEEMKTWVLAGAAKSPSFHCPADEEGFWKDRKAAISEFEDVLSELWVAYKNNASTLSREQSQRVVEFFVEAQEMLSSISRFANPSLQWLNTKLQARKGNLWKVSKWSA